MKHPRKTLQGNDEDNASKSSGETVEKNDFSTKEEVTESPEEYQAKKDLKEAGEEDKEKMDDSPVMGLLIGNKSRKSGVVETDGMGKNEIPRSVSSTLCVVRKITMAGVRRLLEEDLELNKLTLDPFKKLITEQLDKVLSSNISKSSVVKKRSSACLSKTSKRSSSGGTSDSSDKDSEDLEDKVKSKKKNAPKGKVQRSEVLKKRKRTAKETQLSNKKQNKLAEPESEGNSDAKDDGNVSEDGHSQSSAEKTVKVIVPPSVYKKAKQMMRVAIKACITDLQDG
ncbi:hypothetical protein RJ640_025064 [Escallonia rubra]|uniref:Uncharacterized protein n=1 Tax=Escallonia rubra TaxID=112253 RepID=A0AA88UML0_9ASTE|nr:hypothetical protein RJ640_025064 [Escallonia rubra]